MLRSRLFTVTACSALLLLGAIGCGPKVHFMRVGSGSYPPKPADEVVVFLDQKPDRDYKVIGMVFIEVEAGLLQTGKLSDPKTINRLKKAAGKRGADAVFDFQFSTEPQIYHESNTGFNVQMLKRAEAKAIVFK